MSQTHNPKPTKAQFFATQLLSQTENSPVQTTPSSENKKNVYLLFESLMKCVVLFAIVGLYPNG